MNVACLAVLAVLAAQSPDSTPASAPNPSVSSLIADPDHFIIDADAIVREGGVHSIADLLNGRVPGLLVVSGAALNGGGSRIRFAGPRRLLSEGAPLILIDGVRVDATADASLFDPGGPGPLRLEDFNVQDIATIEVVRSPADAMLYGPGAADGAILITTKRGRSGKVQADGYAQAQLQTIPSNWPANYGGVDLDNPDSLMRSGYCTLRAQAAGMCVQDFVQSFNPLVQRSPFTTAVRRQAGFSASGGPRWGAFRAAAATDGDGGLYDVPVVGEPDSYHRWNLGGSGTINANRYIDLGFAVHRLSSKLDLPNYEPVVAALLGPSDSTGFSWTPMSGPSPQLARQETLQRWSGALEAKVHPVPWFTIHGLLGFDNLNQGDTAVFPGSARANGLRRVRHATSSVSVSASNRAGAIRFQTLAGYERATRNLKNSLVSGPDTDPFCTSVCSAQVLQVRDRISGFYLSEQVSVRDRLVVSGAVRRDDFLTYRQHYTNPSVAVAWTARTRQRGVVGPVRLRVAYGSANEAGSIEALPLIFVPVGTPVTPVHADRVTSLDAGASTQLFDGRWNASVSVYRMRSDTKRLVLVSGSSGFQEMIESGTKIENRGLVATIDGPLLDRQSVRWDIQVSLWGNRNRLRSLVGPEQLEEGYQGLFPGYPTAGYWGERITGFNDANGDGIIAPAEVSVDPRPVWAGTPYPTQGAGLQSSLRLGQRFHISTMLDYRAGQVLFNQTEWYRCEATDVCRDGVDPQTPFARQAVTAAPTNGYPLQYFEDASFLKVRELQFSFDVPPHAVGILGAHEATISLAARNLLTLTPYSGGDPEAGSYGRLGPNGIPTVADYGTIPVPRTWALQVRVSY